MCEVLTANLQLALDGVLSAVVNSFTRVHTSIERTRLPDLQSQNALLAERAVLGLVCDVHLVLVPCYFGLKWTVRFKEISSNSGTIRTFTVEPGRTWPPLILTKSIACAYRRN